MLTTDYVRTHYLLTPSFVLRQLWPMTLRGALRAQWHLLLGWGQGF